MIKIRTDKKTVSKFAKVKTAIIQVFSGDLKTFTIKPSDYNGSQRQDGNSLSGVQTLYKA